MREKIVWFDKPLTNKKAEIHFNADGLISFNSAAQQLLPKRVDLGLSIEKDCREVYVRKTVNSKGMAVTQYKPRSDLTKPMFQRGIPFPCIFELQKCEDNPDIWIGILNDISENKLINDVQQLAKENKYMARSSESMQKILELYHGKLLQLCRLYAKTIPKEDRLSTAQDGFMQAVIQYKPNLHIFSKFMTEFVKNHLKKAISDYEESYKEAYALERTSADGEQYDVFQDTDAMENLECSEIDIAVSQQVSPMAEDVYNLIKEGYDQDEIIDMLKISKSKFKFLKKELQIAIADILEMN